MKRIGLIFIAAVIGGGFYLALRERPTAVDTAIVESGSLHVSIDEEGVTRVRDVYAVSSPIAGHLARTTLDEGEVVKANETVIASIFPMEPTFLDERTRAELRAAAEAARSSVALAEVELQRAQTAHDLAKSNYERAEKLARTKTISISQLEHSYSEWELKKAQVSSAEATIKLRKAELASAEARLQQPSTPDNRDPSGDCCVNITAPIDGIVLKVIARSEQTVSPGTLIAEIGDPANLEIVVDLLSSDAARIEPGATVQITDWGGDNDITGTVRTVEPAAFTKVSSLGIEEQRVNVVIDPASVPNNLGHGFRVLARLGIWQDDNVLTVPIAALFRTGGEWSVFVVSDGKATLRRIKVGQMNNTDAEVTGGLEDGDTVVLYPSDLLEDGSLVEERPRV
ncbi:efflux RND transporter periplasmic adaptor subunit [Hoeflea prorocentri]|uniref:HlyD family efflux transporter periplasmic adaptor subunit n=1 Tax=Hoeflea prorocentri TaxID=1922333 RepID=A0A9X3ZHS6_9HYPH|nr:HlyD family efflux transporter periplasmic adaptor subunit [Hoeflea prorocentri]MCY6382152.1 HlyD family efflux transporter periplasmic adaptor subunit [Hoeflea prorocentri]MDA5399952.1 HlyD family efflux transporter periplasmic adaptor subunit [Hoeflea prorocentri]